MDKKKYELRGAEAVDLLLGVYADGFITGISSALATTHRHVPVEERDAFAEKFTDDLMNDPLMREAIGREIAERLAGRDSGPKQYRLP